MKPRIIEILDYKHRAFRDTEVGKMYSAIVFEEGDIVPAEFTDWPDVPAMQRTILFFDERGAECAWDTLTTENIYFKFVD